MEGDLQKLLTFEATEKLLNSNILSCEFISTDSSKMCDISCGKLCGDVKLKKVAKSEKMFSKVGRRGMFQQCQHTQDKGEGARRGFQIIAKSLKTFQDIHHFSS